MHFQSAYNQYQPLFSNKAILDKIVINIKNHPFNPSHPCSKENLSTFVYNKAILKKIVINIKEYPFNPSHPCSKNKYVLPFTDARIDKNAIACEQLLGIA